MNIKTVLLCIFALLFTQASLTWGGPIYSTVKKRPLNLLTPLGNLTPKEKIVTSIGCVDVRNGLFTNCSFDIRIDGLAQPDTALSNNGGHTHGGTHPVGDLQMTFPTKGGKTQIVIGQTRNSYVNVEHEMPEVSGKIDTIFNLHVQPGWYTVYPESCFGNGASWCFYTTVDVGLSLTPLLDSPSLYNKVRTPDTNHTDSVAFYGTDSAIRNLNSIADWYSLLTWKTLSINDMSLTKGGLFDVQANYLRPHREHRTGESVDINKNNGDCTNSKSLLLSVFLVMGRDGGQIFANRQLPSLGHFLCETGNHNNIHIDL